MCLCACVRCVQCQREGETEGERECLCVQNGYHAHVQAGRAEGAGAQFQPLTGVKNSSSCVIKLTLPVCVSVV